MMINSRILTVWLFTGFIGALGLVLARMSEDQFVAWVLFLICVDAVFYLKELWKNKVF
jgi:hypothetical protein